MNKDFSKLCTPARIYFAIAVIAAIFALFNGASMMMEFWKIVFAFIWTFVLGWLCDKGYKSISWFLVLLPYILMFLAMSNIYHTTEDQRQIMRMVKLQGAYGREPFEGGVEVQDESAKEFAKKTELNAKKKFSNITQKLF